MQLTTRSPAQVSGMSGEEAPTAGLFINGAEVPAISGSTFPVYAPEDGRVVGHAALGTTEDVSAAIEAAQAASAVWNGKTPAERELLFFRAADLLEQAEDRFVRWLIDEGGSTIMKARFEFRYTANILRTAGGEARRMYGDTFPADRNDRMSIVNRQPLGVIAAISPFNAPLILLVKMIAFPLAVGNTVVAKPSEETPMVGVELARIMAEAGFPPGAFNVVTGMREAGSALVNDARVKGITFTGPDALSPGPKARAHKVNPCACRTGWVRCISLLTYAMVPPYCCRR